MASSVIRAFDYDPVEQALDVVFVSGRRYRYHDVPDELYGRMLHATSVGEFFNAHVRDQFSFTELE